MSFGYERQPQGMLNDSVILRATLYAVDGTTLVPQSSIHSVTFTIVTPTDDPDAPTVANVAGVITGDGTAEFVVDPSVNITAGQYRGIASFTYDDDNHTNLVKSIPVLYDVIDPFERTGTSPADGAIRQAWMKLEDCFDSEFGGPWLRDMTLAVFDQSKLRGLLPEVFLEINQQMPFTNYDETTFPYGANDGEALLAEGLLIAGIRHLMRSYTEQPDVTSSPVAFMDRKRYQQSWKAVYDVEETVYIKWLKQFKLRSYDLSSSSILLGQKAGRMLPAPMRSRNVGRGF